MRKFRYLASLNRKASDADSILQLSDNWLELSDRVHIFLLANVHCSPWICTAGASFLPATLEGPAVQHRDLKHMTNFTRALVLLLYRIFHC